jgi:hypothetical protein
MKLDSQSPVRLLDLRLGGIAVDFQDLVIIAFFAV